jgi:hypothetical protein
LSSTALFVVQSSGVSLLTINLQTQVTSSTNSAAYGDIYQWGRRKDGHESRGSDKISTRLASITATDNRFIVSICPRKPAVGILRKLDKASAVVPISVVSAASSALVGALKSGGQMSLAPPSAQAANPNCWLPWAYRWCAWQCWC